MMASVYLLDANVFIQAARSYYAFDLAPAFWQALIDQAGNGRVQSIDRVKEELLRGNDDLAAWTKDVFSVYFARTDQDKVVAAYREIMVWVQQQHQFTDPAKAHFAGGADGWLVAYARVNEYVVVTHEPFRQDVRKKILIPNVCRPFSVGTVDTFAMLRALGVKLG